MNNRRLKAKDERLMELIGTDRDGLVEALKSHGAIIREADEWRPLADHVLALIELALASNLKERKAAKEKLAVYGSTVKYGNEVHRLQGPRPHHLEDTAPDVYDMLDCGTMNLDVGPTEPYNKPKARTGKPPWPRSS